MSQDYMADIILGRASVDLQSAEAVGATELIAGPGTGGCTVVAQSYEYTGTQAFGDDTGTLWPTSTAGCEPLSVHPESLEERPGRVREAAGIRPIIWFVDDERGNREWFRDHHRDHFAVITFSARRHVVWALQHDIPCDAVVSDIFFPYRKVDNEPYAEQLLAIYREIHTSTVGNLWKVWEAHRDLWALHGFDIAYDIAEGGQRRGGKIPVFLFSRKATLLLNMDDFPREPAGIEDTLWMIEKPDPGLEAAVSAQAARIQRVRITVALKQRRRTAPLWQRVLGRLSISVGPFSYQLPELGGGR